jgi:proteic killer suppression protein
MDRAGRVGRATCTVPRAKKENRRSEDLVFEPAPAFAYHKATLYNEAVIRTFRHKGLNRFFRTGSQAGIRPEHAARLRVLLTALEAAAHPGDMNASGWRLHRLRGGELAGFYSVTVSGNWRLVFRFDGTDAVDVDYLDYH